MDPQANIDEQDRIFHRIWCARRGPAYTETQEDADYDRLQELQDALKGWIGGGGWIPDSVRPIGVLRMYTDYLYRPICND